MVKAITAMGWPALVTMKPALPWTSTWCRSAAASAPWRAPAGDGFRATGHLRPTHAEIDPGHDVRVEHGDERVEVASAAGGEEGVHDLSLTGDIALLRRRLSFLHSAAGSAGQLPGCVWGTAHYRRDLVEWQVEDVVQHEGEADRVRQDGLRLGIGPAFGTHDGIGDGLLAPVCARTEQVEADPSDDRRQPRPEVLDPERTSSHSLSSIVTSSPGRSHYR